jgi:choice-of-anchor A domain-containing protein
LQGQNDFKYNTIIFGDFVGTSDTQGALVVCGDADLRGYSVGDALPPDVNRNDLIVKGDLTFLTGRVHAGNIVYGNDATIGNSVAHGMMNRTITQNPDAYDCASAESWYKVMSLGLGAQPATGATHIEDDGTVVFTRQGAGMAEFFDLECSSLPLINKMTFHGIPNSQTVVVNWKGTECDVSNLNIVPQNPSMVVFNFPEATSINIKTAAIEATVIAPMADITGNGGVIKGQVVAASWSGSTQQNYMECLACLETFVVGF